MTLRHLCVLSLLLLLAPACGGDDSGDGPAGSDLGRPDQGGPADLGPADTGPSDPDQGETPPDLGPPDLGPPDLAQEPDFDLPDLGPLDQGLRGCELSGCPGAQICDPQGACREPAACGADADCLGTRICLDGACAEACPQSAVCEGQTWCHAPTGRCREPGGCETHAGCLEGRVCRGDPGRCEAPLEPGCDAAHPCAGGLICGQRGLCEEPLTCTGDEDCWSGRVCGAEGRCLACRGDEDCPGGTTCLVEAEGPVCSEPALCAGDDDCLPGRRCADGACAPATECPDDPFEPDERGEAPLLQARAYRRSLCAGGDEDRLRIFVPAGQGLVATLRSDLAAGLPGFDASIVLYDRTAGREIARFDRPGTAEEALLPLALRPTELELRIAAPVTAQGPYEIDLALLPTGLCADDSGEDSGGDDSSARARPLTPGHTTARLCPGDEDWYRVAIPEAGQRLRVRLATSGLLGEALMELFQDPAGPAAQQGLTIEQDALPAQPVWLRVSGAQGPYTLELELLDAAGQTRCDGAPVLQPGVARSVALAAPGVDSVGCPGAPLDPAALPDALAQIELPQASGLRISAQGAGATGRLALRQACSLAEGPLACAAAADGLDLPFLEAGTYYLVVEAEGEGAAEEVELTAVLSQAQPPPSNDRCGDARPIPFDARGRARVSGSLAGATDATLGDGCERPAALPDAAFRLTLTEPSLLQISTEGALAPWLSLLDSCERPVQWTCSAPGQRLQANALPAGDYLLLAEGDPAAPDAGDGSFVLDVRRSAVATADICLGAVEVGAGGIFEGDTSALASDYSLGPANCTGASTNGRDMAFAVDLRVGQQVTAVLESEWDGQLYLVRDCDSVATTCVAGIEINPGGQEETLRYTAEANGRYYLIVDSWSNNAAGPFRLSLSIDGDCTTHRDCEAGFRCIGFHCVQPECAADEDCPEPGATCIDQLCEAPECRSHRACREEGGYCIDYRCRPPEGEAYGSGLVDLAIPDASPEGLLVALSVPERGLVGALAVEVALSHPYSGDLVITLVSPSGTRVRLHNQTGGATPFEDEVFGLAREPDGPGLLQDLADEPSEGLWFLEIADLAEGDVGQVEGWALRFLP